MAAQTVKDVFEQHIPGKFKAKPDVVSKINAVYQFNISGPCLLYTSPSPRDRG